MSNNLDRRLAVVTSESGGTSKLIEMVEELGFLKKVFSPQHVGEISASEFDAIVFDDTVVEHSPGVEKILREFHSDFKPIAVIGRSMALVASIFGDDLELAVFGKTPPDDFVSDRDFKILSTLGSDRKGVVRLLRELLEMA